jgi:hypothetical protein
MDQSKGRSRTVGNNHNGLALLVNDERARLYEPAPDVPAEDNSPCVPAVVEAGPRRADIDPPPTPPSSARALANAHVSIVAAMADAVPDRASPCIRIAERGSHRVTPVRVAVRYRSRPRRGKRELAVGPVGNAEGNHVGERLRLRRVVDRARDVGIPASRSKPVRAAYPRGRRARQAGADLGVPVARLIFGDRSTVELDFPRTLPWGHRPRGARLMSGGLSGVDQRRSGERCGSERENSDPGAKSDWPQRRSVVVTPGVKRKVTSSDVCEHTFADFAGTRLRRLSRALDRGNASAALAAAADLPHVGLVDALELCLLLRDDGARFDRAIVRWQARYATETAGVTVDEAQAVLATLAALRGPRGGSAAHALAELLDRRGLERAGEVLIRWAGSVDVVERGEGTE